MEKKFQTVRTKKRGKKMDEKNKKKLVNLEKGKYKSK